MNSAAPTDAPRPSRSPGVTWPRLVLLAAALALYGGAVYWAAQAAMARDDGQFTYALDDPYTHLAIAKNVLAHGVWGVTPHEFSSTSSSPLWTWLLVGWGRVAGLDELAPLWLNVAFSVAAIGLAFWFLCGSPIGWRAFALGLATAVFACSLPALTVAGMEHALHAVVGFVFVVMAADELAAPAGERSPGRIAALAGLAGLLVFVRYEGLFAVFVVCVLLLRQRKVLASAVIGAGAWVPIGLFGAWAVQHGWPFFPVSVLLKRTSAPTWDAEGLAESAKAIQLFLTTATVPLLLAGAAAALLAERRKRGVAWDRNGYLLLLFVATCLLHVVFAKTGWYFRYEAYLVFWAALVGAVELPRLWALRAEQRRGARETMEDATASPAWYESFWRVAGIPLALALVLRGVRALTLAPDGMTNIYEQQIQFARFFQTYYNTSAVAVNDIGAVCWLTHVKLLDLYGLASLDVAEAKFHRRFDTALIDQLAKERNVRVAVVYDHWFTWRSALPPTWQKVGTWEIPRLATVSAEMVEIYAVAPDEREPLIAHLREFSSRLPKEVVQSGEYVNPEGAAAR